VEYRYFLRLIAHKITIRKTAMPRKIAAATMHASLRRKHLIDQLLCNMNLPERVPER
jgi:hypothetical protein